MENKTLWDLIKDVYYINFGIPPYVTDFRAIADIVKLSLSGYGNRRISRSLRMSPEYIRRSLQEFMNFEGWEEDLDFNPIALYNRSNRNLERYEQEVSMISEVTDRYFIVSSFTLCKNYYTIIKEVEIYVN